MADCMEFPNDWAKFLEDYSFMDNKEFYTNGARLIPTFRVEQMMHHYLQKTTEDSVVVVRCKDCKHRGDDVHCPMCFEEAIEWDDDGYTEVDYVLHDRTTDDGFCDRGERRVGE